jgi:hypothetical protein
LFAEAFGHYVKHAPEEQLLEYVDTYGSELAPLIPALADRIPDLPPTRATDSDSQRALLFAAVSGLLARLSQHDPVVLVLDDLQWADKGSLAMLRHLAASDLGGRLLVLGTYRDSELSRSHPFLNTLAALRRVRHISRIALTGLDEAEVLALMEASAGLVLGDQAVRLAHTVYLETDGNPFFASEVLRDLRESGAIYEDATGHWVARDRLDQVNLPESVREVIAARVGRLGDRSGRILSLAAVIGRDFDLDLLAGSTEIPFEDLLDTLEAAAAASLVVELDGPAGNFTFAHALIQLTLYEDLGPTRRARVHRTVAEALEQICAGRPGYRVGELARHWLNATQPIDLSKAITYARQAGDAALSGLAPAQALGLYTQALDLYAQTDQLDPMLALDLAIGIGTSQRQTGDPAYRLGLLAAARRAAQLEATDRLVAAVLASDRGFFGDTGVVDEEKLEILGLALERLPPKSREKALVQATLCSELNLGSSLEHRKALADEAISIAKDSGDDVTIVRVLNQVFLSLNVPSLLEESLERSADALTRAERIGDPVLLLWATLWRAEAAVRAGDIGEVDRCIGFVELSAEQLGQPTLNWVVGYTRAWRAQISGSPDQADELASRALQIGQDSGEPDAHLFWDIQVMNGNWQHGTMNAAIDAIGRRVAASPRIRSLTAALALANAEVGRMDEVRRLLAEFEALEFILPMDLSWTTGMVRYAAAATECRDPRFAGPIFDQLKPWSAQFSCLGSLTSEGPVSHYLGGLAIVLGRYSEAESYFVHASAMSKRMGSKFFAAQTDLYWGRLLAERQAPGDTEKARDLLTRACAHGAAYGYTNIEGRARADLESLS